MTSSNTAKKNFTTKRPRTTLGTGLARTKKKIGWERRRSHKEKWNFAGAGQPHTHPRERVPYAHSGGLPTFHSSRSSYLLEYSRPLASPAVFHSVSKFPPCSSSVSIKGGRAKRAWPGVFGRLDADTTGLIGEET